MNNYTFKDLYVLIQRHVSSRYLQIYSNKHQVNILNDDGLSLLNIIFDDEDENVKLYRCPNPGYCDYDSEPIVLQLNDSIDRIPYLIPRRILEYVLK